MEIKNRQHDEGGSKMKLKRGSIFFKRTTSVLVAASIVLGSTTYALADDVTSADPDDTNEPTLQNVLTVGGSKADTLEQTIKSIDGKGYIAVGYTTSKDGDLSGVHTTTGTTGMLAFIGADANGTPTSTEKVLTFGGDRNSRYSATTDLYSIAAVSDGYVIAGSTMSNKITDANGDEGAYHAGTDAILMKVDTSGNLEWVKYWGGSSTDEFKHVIVSGDTIIAMGDTCSSDGDVTQLKGTQDGVVVAYGLDGTKKWQTSIGGTASAQTDVSVGSAVADSGGNIYLDGCVWQNDFTSEGVGDFATKSNGGEALSRCMVPITGASRSLYGDNEGFVAKLNMSTGKIEWIQASDEIPNACPFAGNNIFLNSKGKLVLTGEVYDGTVYTNGYGSIASMDTDGTILSTQLITGNVGYIYGGGNNSDDDMTSSFDMLLISDATELSDGTYIGVGSTTADLSPASPDSTTLATAEAKNSEYDFAGKNHTVDFSSRKAEAILFKFDLSGHIYWIQNIGSSTGAYGIDDTAESVFTTSGGGYVVTGTSGAQDGDFSTAKYSDDFYFAKFSKDIDTDGDGVSNNRDAYPNDATKSVDPTATYDYTASPKLTFTGTNSAGAKWSDLYSYLLPMKTRAECDFKATDNVLFDLGNSAKVTAPFATLDAAIGTDKTDALTFTYASTTVGDTNSTTYASPFKLSASLGSKAVTSLEAPVQVTMPIDGTTVKALKAGASLELDTLSGSTSTKVSGATFDASAGTVTFKTSTLGDTYAVSAPAAQITVDSYTTGETNQSITVTAHVTNGTFSDGSTTATHTFTGNDSYTFEASNALGKTASKTVTITNIKKSAPTITLGNYDGTTPTNKDITVTATTDSDATLNATSHTFTANGSFTFTATDKAGNTTSQTVTIANIDKTAPTITLGNYDGTTPTNKDVTVTATTDSDATLNSTSHTFSANGSFTFTATDQAGNTTSKTVTITNIDKVAPTITLGNYDTSPTTKSVTVTATTDSGATLNATSHTFTQNGSFDFVATDQAGNVTTKTVTVNNILTSLSGATSDDSVAVDAPVASLPDGVTSVSVQVEAAASGSSAFATVQTALGNQGYNTVAVDSIELLDENGQVITGLTGNVTVKIKIPDGATGNLKVLWYNPVDGSTTDMNAKEEGGYLVFQTNHFSCYVVASAKNTSSATTSTDSTATSLTATASSPSENTMSSEVANPNTGENQSDPRAVLYATLAAVLTAGGAAAFQRKRKHRG